MDKTIDLPVMRRLADMSPATLDEVDRSVEVCWSTGSRYRRHSLFGDAFDEELSMDPAAVRLSRLNNGAPLLRVHDQHSLDAVIGSVVPGSARIMDGRGYARVRFSDREDATRVLGEVKAGHIRAVSIGYQVHRYVVQERDGEPDLYTAVDWTPMEISAVPIGADPDAGFRSAQELQPCTVSREGAHERTLMDTEAPPAEVTPDLAPEPARAHEPAVVDVVAVTRHAQKAERERVSTIMQLGDKLGMERSFTDDLIAGGVPLEDARKRILNKLADESDKVRISSVVAVPLGGQDDRVTRTEAATNALLNRYDATQFPLTDAGRQFRGMRMVEMARSFLDASGTRTSGLAPYEIVDATLGGRGASAFDMQTRAGLHTTSDFPLVLASVTSRSLRAAYEAAPRTFTAFARRVTAPDFRMMSRVQIGGGPELLKVNEHGEFKRGTLTEGKEEYKIATYGRVVGITRQVIINDDLNAFTDIPAKFGTSVANLENDVAWGAFLSNPTMSDGVALFHASHGNLAASGTAIDATTVAAAFNAMSKQKDLDTKTFLNITPAYLVVPGSKLLIAEQLLGTVQPATGAAVVPNRITRLVVVSDPRVEANSATAWYLVGMPSQVDSLEYAYLEGQEGAYTETRIGFDIDGIEVKCRLDFGAKVVDWRGVYKNPGA